MASAVTSRLPELVKQLQKFKGSGARKDHRGLLAAYANHGKGASAGESIQVLELLVNMRPGRGAHHKSFPQWRQDCASHKGFELLREQLLQGNKISKLANTDLSRVYSRLNAMGFYRDAEAVRPFVAERVKKKMEPTALLGVWQSAPKEFLPELDEAVDQMLSGAVPQTWQLLAALSRAHDCPSCSSVEAAVEKLADSSSARLKDVSPGDMISLIERLPRAAASGLGGADALAREVRAMLASKPGVLNEEQGLQNDDICRLTNTIQDFDDPLWPVIRSELVGRKSWTQGQLLRLAHFFKRLPPSLVAKEQLVVHNLAGWLIKSVRSVSAEDPRLLLEVAEVWDIFLQDGVQGGRTVIRLVLNAAVSLSGKLRPEELRSIFIQTAEANVLESLPEFKNRVVRIAEALEKHNGFVLDQTLKDMDRLAAAMQTNGVMRPDSLQKMASRFVEVFDEMQKRVPGDADSEAETSGDKAQEWLSLAEERLVSFWVRLAQFGVDHKELTETVKDICVERPCRLDTPGVLRLLEMLCLVTSPTATKFHDGLAEQLRGRVPDLDLEGLLSVAAVSRADALKADVAAALTSAVESLVKEQTEQGRLSVSTFDGLVSALKLWSQSILPWPGAQLQSNAVDAEVPEKGDGEAVGSGLEASSEKAAADGEAIGESAEAAAAVESGTGLEEDHRKEDLVHQTASAVGNAILAATAAEPSAARGRLCEAAMIFGSLNLQDNDAIMLLQQCLHVEGSFGGRFGECSAKWELPLVTDLAFSFVALYGGKPPLDVIARLWGLVGAALERQQRVDMSPLTSAKLWAFCLAAKRLSSDSTACALRLSPVAFNIEAFLQGMEAKPSAKFTLETSPAILGTTVPISLALSRVVDSELVEENFVIPGTPYIVDLAVPARQVTLLVPRTGHRTATATGWRLSGEGEVLERIVETAGWRIVWLKPEAWQSLLLEEGQEAEAAIQKRLRELIN